MLFYILYVFWVLNVMFFLKMPLWFTAEVRSSDVSPHLSSLFNAPDKCCATIKPLCLWLDLWSEGWSNGILANTLKTWLSWSLHHSQQQLPPPPPPLGEEESQLRSSPQREVRHMAEWELLQNYHIKPGFHPTLWRKKSVATEKRWI